MKILLTALLTFLLAGFSYADYKPEIKGLDYYEAGGGSGTVSSGTADRAAIYDTAGTTIVSSLVITDNGTNVGIGSAAPGAALDVNGAVRANGQVTGTNLSGTHTGTSSGTNTGDQTTFAGFSTNSAGLAAALSDEQGTGAAVFATAPNLTGNVGIGSAAPGATLDVQGTIRSSSSITGSSVTATGTGSSYTSGNLGVGTSLPGNQLSVNGGVGIGTAHSNYVQNRAAPAGGMIVEGNVGVGSLAPGAKLDVTGTARVTGFQLSTGAATSYILQTNSVGVGTWVDPATVVAGGSGTPGGSSPQLQYNNGGSFDGITSGGSNGTNIGIGTVQFNKTLNVVGNVGISTLANSNYIANALTGAAVLVTDGNVGIGTWKPVAALEVKGGSIRAGAGNIVIDSSGNISSPNSAAITAQLATVYSVDGSGITVRGRNTSSGSAGAVTVHGGNNDNTGAAGAGTFRGGDTTVNDSGAAGQGNFRGGDVTNSSSTAIAGNAVVRPGGSSNATGNNGRLLLSNTYRASAGQFEALNNIACISSSNTIGDCPTSSTNFVGVGIGTTAPGTAQFGGIVTQVPFDGTYSPSAGWYACTSPTTAGKVLPQSTPCPMGRQLGIITVGASSVGVGTFMVWPVQGGGTVTDNGTNVGIGSATPGKSLDVQGTGFRAIDYFSGDGTQGVTVTTCTSFKDGLCVAGT